MFTKYKNYKNYTNYTKYTNYVNNMMAPIFLIFSSLFFIKNVSNELSSLAKPTYNYRFYRNIFVFLGSLGCSKYMIRYTIKSSSKIQESVESFLFYTYNTLILHRCLSNKEWFTTLVLFDNIEHHVFTELELVVYQLQISHYLLELLYFFYRDIKRKDDKEMLIHHIITLILIIGSYHTNLIRAGLYVMYLHDINDIFLQLSKTLVYHNVNENITNSTFGIFIVSWIYTRLYLYGILVYDMGANYYNINFLLNTLFYCLCILYTLNVIWFKLIIDVLIKTVFGKKLVDVREE
jgi:very-long-chain ceramide synthase